MTPANGWTVENLKRESDARAAELAAAALTAAAELAEKDKDRAAAVVKEDKQAAADVLASKESRNFYERIVVLVLTVLGPLLTAMVLYYQSQTYALQKKTHDLTNSMSEKLLKTTSDASHAEGVLEGKASKAKGGGP